MKVCIIGAGLSGLVTIKELKEEGHEVVCYEQGSATGGVFRPNDGKNPAYDEMSLTVSNYFMAFSSLPPEEPERRYWSRAEYHAYLQKFAATFDLLPHIVFHAQVTAVEPQADGGWVVRTVINEREHEAHYEGVAVCSGQFRQPLIPQVKGLERFQGVVLHTVDYQNAAAFQGKRVVCVGLGESGADICHQVAQVAHSTTLVVRHPAFLLPRNWLPWHGIADTVDAATCRMTDKIFSEHRAMATTMFKFIDPLRPAAHDESEFIATWHRLSDHVFGQYAVKNDIFIRDILDHKLTYNLFGVTEVGEDYIRCGDEQKIAADVIIFNTGYQHNLGNLLNSPELNNVMTNPRGLYKHMFHPKFGAKLAFIGFTPPDVGGVPTCAELQARYWAQLCSGKAHLPAADRLRQLIQREAEAEASSFYRKPLATGLIRYQAYTDGLARLIGCYPKPPLFNPSLLVRYYYGSAVGNWFRMNGPGSNRQAAKAVIQRLPINFPPLIRLGLLVTITAMNLAVLVDKLTFGRLAQRIARQRPQPIKLLKQELKRKSINPTAPLGSLCADWRTWHHLKYKLHKVYQLNPKVLREALTVAQLVDLCTATPPAPTAHHTTADTTKHIAV